MLAPRTILVADLCFDRKRSIIKKINRGIFLLFIQLIYYLLLFSLVMFAVLSQ